LDQSFAKIVAPCLGIRSTASANKSRPYPVILTDHERAERARGSGRIPVSCLLPRHVKAFSRRSLWLPDHRGSYQGTASARPFRSRPAHAAKNPIEEEPVPPGTPGNSPATFPRRVCALRNKCREKKQKQFLPLCRRPTRSKAERTNPRKNKAPGLSFRFPLGPSVIVRRRFRYRIQDNPDKGKDH